MSAYNFYPKTGSFDLREEIHGILHGDELGDGVGRSILIRRIKDQTCVCFDKSKGSTNPGCRYCLGEGYMWTETLNFGYLGRNLGSVLGSSTVISNQNALANFGTSDDGKALAYFEYDVFPNYERYLRPDHPTCDKLFELKVDDNGNLVQPIIRVAKWKMRSVTPHQGDRGRIEFFECGLDKENL